jgi:hypothetical protein
MDSLLAFLTVNCCNGAGGCLPKTTAGCADHGKAGVKGGEIRRIRKA